MNKTFFWLCIATCMLVSWPTRADVLTLALDPANGAVSGLSGSTVGWGFTLSNNSIYWAAIDESEFCATGSPVPALCNPPSPNLGTYTDFLAPQLLEVGPSPGSVSQTFDNNVQTGIGSFAIDSGASGVVNGVIVVEYELFTVDPNDPDFNPETDTFATSQIATAPASVSAVPEPSPAPILMTAMLALGGVLRLKFFTSPTRG